MLSKYSHLLMTNCNFWVNINHKTGDAGGMMAHELQKYGVFHGITGKKDEILWSALRESISRIENLEKEVKNLKNLFKMSFPFL